MAAAPKDREGTVKAVSFGELCGLYLATTQGKPETTADEASSFSGQPSTTQPNTDQPSWKPSRAHRSLGDRSWEQSELGSGLHRDTLRSTDGAVLYVTHVDCTARKANGMAEDLLSVSFDQFASLRDDEIVPTVIDIFERLGICQGLGVTKEAITRMVGNGLSLYHKQPAYHTHRHAFDVFQATYFLLVATELRDTASHLEVFCLLIAALLHDVGHPGLTNDFHIREATPFAKFASFKQNSSDVNTCAHPNEVWHGDITRRLLLSDDGLLPSSHFSEETRAKVDRLVQQLISATDPSTQPDFLKSLDARLRQGDCLATDSTAPDDRLLILSLVMRCADVFHPLRPFHLHKKWALLFTKEISRQLMLEYARRKVPVKDPYGNLGASTIDFLNFHVIPLFRYFVKVFPDKSFTSTVLLRLNAKVDIWKSYDMMRETRATARDCVTR
uniref:Phosphodiesterase n=1 Tax=Pyramimonas obovata TaxID=1411642 RepID=A0A7S0QNP2_9CHLO|mmetsp:Transcript_12708/g.26829  ORF Transcript_12708/g.26829 Transcript_12708/m.26829 type:complete len:444 (+) Transcript_12708:187-1518(+)|eukprot:CAMPEP_0118927226 /NCGR_PEP_ID=MMETSP1169-20130426/4734_1 /TAXON_ID=36882 /ORGANISM="Pyramimonas obovata, Strain CCMP722" /LENGTH=443 /DNA_ID=CAMNT_0006868949 /DNA_START=186 /DNA_END=1517 /DNA_ORIENTATION=-